MSLMASSVQLRATGTRRFFSLALIDDLLRFVPILSLEFFGND
jgi:hypothetical protein